MDSDQATVLLVEDEPLILFAVSDVLRRHGIRVIEALDAEEAIAKLDKGARADVVLTDVCFPSGRDGFAFVRWLREREVGAQIFVTSGQVRRDEAVRELDRSDAFIAKPYNARALASRLAGIAKQRNASASACASASAPLGRVK